MIEDEVDFLLKCEHQCLKLGPFDKPVKIASVLLTCIFSRLADL